MERKGVENEKNEKKRVKRKGSKQIGKGMKRNNEDSKGEKGKERRIEG